MHAPYNCFNPIVHVLSCRSRPSLHPDVNIVKLYALPLTMISLILSLHSAACMAQAESGFSSLEERMTLQEFEQAGLGKLSAEELAALNDWIRAHSLGGEQYAHAEAAAGNNNLPPSWQPDRMGFLDYKGEEKPITSTIVGSFAGWRGETEFELANGMVWKQAEQGMLGVKPRENQQVTIEPGFLSAWYLKIDGINRRLKVRRIK